MTNPRKNSTILFVVSTLEYYRNYITSPALSKIKERCVFIVHEKLIDKNFPVSDKKDLISYMYPERKKIFHRHMFNINMWKFRNLSTSFVFRFARLKNRQKLIYQFLSLPLVYHFAKFVLLHRAHDPALEQIISQVNPSLILMPSGGYEGLSFEIIKIAKTKKIPTCLLIDNWDNLSSKTVFTWKPDYLVVWGQQALEDAVRIHKMDENRVFLLGTPRFIEYVKENKLSLPSPYPFKYALFAGNALPFDELTVLRAIDEMIDKNGHDIKVVYRPHPWRKHRKCADIFFEYDFRHTVLDTPARLYYKGDEMDDFNDTYIPDLKYYPRLLSNMEFMICPLSTMIIEGLLFGKKVFVLAYDDGIHPTNPKECLHYYEHFRGIENLNNVEIIHEFNKIDRIFSGQTNSGENNRADNLNYYLSDKTRNYPDLLANLVDAIIIKGS